MIHRREHEKHRDDIGSQHYIMIQHTDEYKDLFLSEAKNHMQAMNDALLRLEKDPDDLELVNEIFRRAHTLKSMAATMDYQNTARLCHALEDVLNAVKNKAISPTEVVDFLFKSFATLEGILKRIREGETELDAKAVI